MSFTFKTWWLGFVQSCKSMLAHRQPSAPHHIGPYGGSYLDMHQNEKH